MSCDKPHYRLRYVPVDGRPQWQVQHVRGCRKDALSYATSWRRAAGHAVGDAAMIPIPRA